MTVDSHPTDPPALRLQVGAASDLADARRQVTRWAQDIGLGSDATIDLTIAAHEAMENALQHAYPRTGGPVTLTAQRADEEVVVVEVSDEGVWRPAPADPGWRGRGLMVMRQLADQIQLSRRRRGTTVRLRWHHPRAQPPEPS